MLSACTSSRLRTFSSIRTAMFFSSRARVAASSCTCADGESESTVPVNTLPARV
jgi:hypothetical protein